jgi:hypothetical protein
MIKLMRTEVGQTEHITHDALVNSSAYKISERGRTQTAKIRRGKNLYCKLPAVMDFYVSFKVTIKYGSKNQKMCDSRAPCTSVAQVFVRIIYITLQLLLARSDCDNQYRVSYVYVTLRE